MINMLIVDDHQLLREGLRSRIERESGMAVVGEADTAERAVVMARAATAGPDPAGPSPAANEWLRRDPRAGEGCASSEDPRRLVAGGAELGAARPDRRCGGYLPKRSSDRELLSAIRLVGGGGGYVDPALGARLVNDHGSPALEPLSERERDIVQLLALGYTNQEMGKKLFISVRTVDTHRAHIMRKLELETRAELVMFALANGVIGPDSG
ncbi:MAG TPA: response regulator transcription factor [Gaiellaceae bacterium]